MQGINKLHLLSLSSSYLFQLINQPKHDDNKQHLPVFRQKCLQIKRARSQTCLGSRPVPVKTKTKKQKTKKNKPTMLAAQGHNYKIENGNFFQIKNWRLCKNLQGYANSNSGRSLSDVPFDTSLQNCLCALYFCPIIYEVDYSSPWFNGLTDWESKPKWLPLSLAGAATSIMFLFLFFFLLLFLVVVVVATNTSFLATNVCLPRQNICRDKNYVCRNKIHLSRQAYFCRDRRSVLSQ